MKFPAEQPSGAPRSPPGPRGHFLLGNLPEFARDVLEFVTECAQRHGDVVGLRLAGRRVLLLNHPELSEQVLVTEQRSFGKHSFFYRHVRAICGTGLLVSEGEYWLRQRRLAQRAFQRERIAAYGDVMVAYTQRMLDGWSAGETRDVHEDLMHVTFLIVAKVLFDADLQRDVAAVGGAVDAAMTEVAARIRRPLPIPDAIPIPGNLRYRRAVGRLDAVVRAMIRGHRERGAGGHDLLSLLMAARDESGAAMTDDQLRDEALTLLAAGHETSAVTLSWALYLLALHPEVAEELARELDAVLGARDPSAADLPRLGCTESVVNETLRLYPPVWAFGREARRPCEIRGYPVRSGTTLLLCPWLAHRDPRYFDAPLQFRPGRWRDGSLAALPKYAYLPFGGGPRLCIGARFAMQEAMLLLACIVRRFRFSLDPAHPVVPFPSITLRPAHGLRLRLARRADR